MSERFQEIRTKKKKNTHRARPWWRVPLIPALGRQRQVGDLCDSKASLVYRVSYRTSRAISRNPNSKNKKANKERGMQEEREQPRATWQQVD